MLQCASYSEAMDAVTRARLGARRATHPLLTRDESSVGRLVLGGSSQVGSRSSTEQALRWQRRHVRRILKELGKSESSQRSAESSIVMTL